MTQQLYHLLVYVPVSHADRVRAALGKAGAGRIGAYEYCSFSVKGTGRFLPMKGSKPAIGKIGKIAKVPEERIEIVVEAKMLKKVLHAVKEAHPYEEPAIHFWEMKNFP